jgi:hypothetical protein
VTVGGQPVPQGTITFIPEGGKRDPYTAAIIDGKYKTDEIPAGPTKVMIASRQGPPAAETGGGDLKAPAKGRGAGKSMVPEKYGNTETSGLSYTVVKGEQTKDFPLEP